VGGKHHRHAVGYLAQFVDEYGALGFQAFDDITVMHDLVPDIDRCAIFLQRDLDDLDRPVDTGAKAAWARQKNCQGPFRHSNYLTLPITLLSASRIGRLVHRRTLL
jgi:hypothetical protein